MNQDNASKLRELAKQVLLANAANIAKKARAGKTLTSAELAILHRQCGTGDVNLGFARNMVQLADALGVTRKSIQRWVKEPGNPGAAANGSYDVAAWREWCAQNGHKLGDDVDINRLKAENILLQNRQLETKIAILDRSFVPLADVEKIGAELGSEVRKVVTSLHLLAPTLAGMSAEQIETQLKLKEDEIVEQLHTLPQRMAQVSTAKAEDALDEE